LCGETYWRDCGRFLLSKGGFFQHRGTIEDIEFLVSKAGYFWFLAFFGLGF
jgi:hypothetical protein